MLSGQDNLKRSAGDALPGLRAFLGVALEVVSLAAVLGAFYFIPAGTSYLLYVVLTQLITTYLIHCPAHYLVGRAVGIRFKSIKLGRTTLAQALPPQLAPLVRLLPILTLSTDKSSLVGLPKARISAMYLSGTVASSGSAIAIAAVVSISGPPILDFLAWFVAIGYLLFDVVFSPKSGDVMRARVARA